MLSQPELNAPVAIVGFKGWANAGEIASSTLSFIQQAAGGLPLAEIESDSFYDFTANRPTARIKDGRVESVEMPTNLFSYCRPPGGPDTILFSGHEPHLKWGVYIDLVTELLVKLDTRLVISLGGTYDERLHSDPPMVSIICEDMVLRETLVGAGGVLGRYEGPISIHTPFYLACRDRGLPVVGLWGHAPVYVQNGNFKQVIKIMELIAALGGPRLDLTSLHEASQEMAEQIETLIARSPKLASYIEKLKSPTGHELPPASWTSRERCKVIPLTKVRKPDKPAE